MVGIELIGHTICLDRDFRPGDISKSLTCVSSNV